LWVQGEHCSRKIIGLHVVELHLANPRRKGGVGAEHTRGHGGGLAPSVDCRAPLFTTHPLHFNALTSYPR
jgi:hypothetical protein